MICHFPRDLTFPWQPYFDRHDFQSSNFSYLKKLNRGFLVAYLKSFDHLIVFLFLLIAFESILAGFLSIWTNPDIQDGGPRCSHSEMITQL